MGGSFAKGKFAVAFAILCLSSAASALNECATVNPGYFAIAWTRDGSDVQHETLCQNPVDGKVYASAWFISGNSTAIPFSGITTGTSTNQGLYGVSNGTFLRPLNFGQVFSTGEWLLFPPDPIPSTGPTWTANNSAGSLVNNQNYAVEFTLVSPNGQTAPSAEVGHQLSTVGCASGSCQIVMTAPVIPAGYTGYTVYARNISNLQTMQQIAGCVNITGNCTFGAIPTTSAPPTTNAVMPLPALAKTSVCPPNVTPISWTPDQNGNLNSEEYISEFNDTTSTGGGPVNPSDAGVRVGCRPRWYSDQGVDPPGGKNAFFLVDHQFGNSGLHPGNQDRVMWLDGATPVNDSAGRYGLEVLQAELDFNCNGCTSTGSPDGEITTISGQMSTAGASTNWTTNGYGTNVIQGRFFRSGTGHDSNPMSAIYGNMSNSNATAAAGARFVALRGAFNSTANATNLTIAGMELDAPVGSRNAAFVKGIFTNCFGTCFTPTSADAFIDQRVHGWVSLLNGQAGITALSNTDGASLGTAMPVDSSLNVTGSVQTSQIAAGWATGYSAACSGGASTYTYQFVAVDANGGQTPSATFNCNVGTNPLTSGNPVTLNPGGNVSTSAVYRQAVRIDVCRVGGPMALGKIGSITINNNIPIFGGAAFSDTGLSASGTCPTANTSGGANFAGYLHSSTNTLQVASDFTSAANTNLQTITGLSWNLDGNAKTYSFHCSLLYSQATAAAAMQFGIQAATVAPTAINAKGRIDTSTSAQTSGALTGLASTTATAIVTFTPSATATVFGADLDGTIEEPANTQGQVVNIMVQTSNSADLPTVKRGSYCTLY